MIRLFSVFGKLHRKNLSDLNWLRYEKSRFSSFGSTCPVCRARGHLMVHGTYSRYLVSLKGGKCREQRIDLVRYRCASCGHTHTAHPSCLVPYSPYSLLFILKILKRYFLRLDTVCRLCERFGISPSTLYRWKARFLSQKELYLGILSSQEQGALAFLDGLKGQTLYAYLTTFASSFLERLPGRAREMPFPLPPLFEEPT